MNLPRLTATLVLMCFAFAIRPALADDLRLQRGTPAEAKALVVKAVAHIHEVGMSQAFRDFSDPDGGFQNKDLYIFVQDYNCTFLAHGLNPALVGRNIWDLKNPNGLFACREIVGKTKTQGEAWTDYVFQDPLTGSLAEKTAYTYGMAHCMVSSGIYR
ncbi:cache domain-containing protein [Thalassospira lucentensis]|uniref:cache domain-containing protein n=1 Tax=Thalassospira lucentensis TaxID=168935 RepID=UPI003D2E9FD0